MGAENHASAYRKITCDGPCATCAVGPYSLAPYPGILLNHLAEYNVLYVRVLYMYIHQCSSSQQYMYNTRT